MYCVFGCCFFLVDVVVVVVVLLLCVIAKVRYAFFFVYSNNIDLQNIT